MPYITTDRVKEIRNELKKNFPTFKLSVTRRHHSVVVVSILEAPFDLMPNKEGKKHTPINYFYIKENYKDTPKIAETLQGIYDIMDEGNRTVSHDGDYGDVPKFYTDLEIGQWDREFKVVER